MCGTSRFTALLVTPDSSLGRQFLALATEVQDLQVIQRLDSYPSLQAVVALARSSKSDLVFLDFTSELDTACHLTQGLAGICPDIHVVGLDKRPNSETLMRALRVGATEFLRAPFEPAEMRGALARIARLRRAGDACPDRSGRVLTFSSAKPGAGASTLATHTALRLRALTGRRTLLMDLNLEGGLVGAELMPRPRCSVLDGLRQARVLDVTNWSKLTECVAQVDLLAAPRAPYDGEVDSEQLHALLASARQAYEWIVLDLPVIFHPLSLLAMVEADQGFIVTTTELPSLHLARRGADWLQQCGFGRERFKFLANRAVLSGSLDRRVMNDALKSPVVATLPNDYRSLYELPRFGETPSERTQLGAALQRFASLLAGDRNLGADAVSPACGLRPAMAR